MSVKLLIHALTTVGDPPELKDELAFRRWCKELSTAMAQWAATTRPEWDNRAVLRLQQAISNYDEWTVLYALVKWMGRR
jgi:hypothetical protein